MTVFGVSLLTLAIFVWGLFYGTRIGKYRGHFFRRVASAYLVAFIVSLGLLILFDKAPLDDLQIALTRTILVAFPATFAATVVDFMK